MVTAKCWHRALPDYHARERRKRSTQLEPFAIPLRRHLTLQERPCVAMGRKAAPLPASDAQFITRYGVSLELFELACTGWAVAV